MLSSESLPSGGLIRTHTAAAGNGRALCPIPHISTEERDHPLVSSGTHGIKRLFLIPILSLLHCLLFLPGENGLASCSLLDGTEVKQGLGFCSAPSHCDNLTCTRPQSLDLEE